MPALNTNRTFINDLADAVLEALPFAGSMAGSNPSDSLVPLGASQSHFYWRRAGFCYASGL